MQIFRPSLWRQARRIATRPARYSRTQHDIHGPHKEYFQTPAQTPLPDATSYAQPTFAQPSHAPSGPSRTIRAARSVLWAILFSTLGLAVGTALITWEYMQPHFEPGSEEEQEILEEILETLESHPLVESLREENWIEENFYSNRGKGAGKGLHLVSEQLSGIKGITMKTFKHPSQEFTMMVFFLGFGLEGWPDVIHGGITTTLLQEGVDRHIQNFYSHYGVEEGQTISVDFKKPVRPGDIYAILIPPGTPHAGLAPGETQIQLVSMLMNMEGAPRVQSSFDAATNTEQHTVQIPTSSSGNEPHAVATVQVRLIKDTNAEQEPINHDDCGA